MGLDKKIHISPHVVTHIFLASSPVDMSKCEGSSRSKCWSCSQLADEGHRVAQESARIVYGPITVCKGPNPMRWHEHVLSA